MSRTAKDAAHEAAAYEAACKAADATYKAANAAAYEAANKAAYEAYAAALDAAIKEGESDE